MFFYLMRDMINDTQVHPSFPFRYLKHTIPFLLIIADFEKIRIRIEADVSPNEATLFLDEEQSTRSTTGLLPLA
jgi:hypothetical protein